MTERTVAWREPPGARRLPVGRAWARTPINTVAYRSAGLLSRAGRQLIGFYDGEQRVVVAQRGGDATRFELIRTGRRGIAQDAARPLAIALSSDGHLHVAHGVARSRLGYARAVTPDDPGSLAEATPPWDPESAAHRLAIFVTAPDGTLLLFWEEIGKATGQVNLARYDTAGQRWVVLHQPLIQGPAAALPRCWRPACGPDGRLHLLWCWRRAADPGTGALLSYATTAATRPATWATSTGAPLALPITAATAEVVDPVPAGEGLLDRGPLVTDPNGCPHTVYLRNGPDGRHRLVHLWHDGATWQSHLLEGPTAPPRADPADLSGPALGRPELVVGRRGDLNVIYRDGHRRGRVRIARAEPPVYRRWTHRTLLPDTVEAWEPCVDRDLWEARETIGLLVQTAGPFAGAGRRDPAPLDLVELHLPTWWSAPGEPPRTAESH